VLPQVYQLPGAIVLIVGGLVACFAGHRFFRVVLGVYGFIFGAMIASSVMGMSNATGMVVAAVVGGLIGALVMMFAWFVGVAVVGAGLGALIAHLIWRQIGSGDPPAPASIVASVAGAVGAMLLQRYVVIVSTAFGGSWTAIVGALHAMEAWRGKTPAADAVWILYPVPAGAPAWLPLAWIGVGLLGTTAQFLVLSKRKR
jgi:Domain of unknown function (DUF4203)